MQRREHPKPQFERENWLNLNGAWQFEIDDARSGQERGLFEEGRALSGTINVPFCPESRLSGVEHKDFMAAVWYKRKVVLAEDQTKGRVILHFGAVDYLATVYVNGKEAGTHKGGYVSFSLDVTALLRAGENEIAVYAEDDVRSKVIPSGKQSERFASYGCMYTRTTGIWQTVWMEFVPEEYVLSARYLTDIHQGTLTLTAKVAGKGVLSAEAFWDGAKVGEAACEVTGDTATLTLKLAETHLWELGKGGLYDLVLSFGEDRVKSYFGLREAGLRDGKFFLNGKVVFQRLVLDQGFYPDGIYTAPSDAELLADVERSMAMGFNGARLHEKVFEERFLYHADRKGYMVWGEYPNWGLDESRADAIYGLLPEWLAEIERDYNHPAIIGWCPLNETRMVDKNPEFYKSFLKLVYHATKALDPTRPVIDSSGGAHVETDVFDVHDYDQDPVSFRASYARVLSDGVIDGHYFLKDKQQYEAGQPLFMSEYGGTRWAPGEEGWGYGDAPKTPEEVVARIKGLTDALLENPAMLGYCYTQLTDVEQEKNGLYTYDRKAKFDPAVISAILSRKSVIED
ncbi:MAG: beta-galactosidase [Clostridia bacterium]|nr:beta-galactosidase [Clostridia bacterium]